MNFIISYQQGVSTAKLAPHFQQSVSFYLRSILYLFCNTYTAPSGRTQIRGSVYLDRDFQPRMRLRSERPQNINIGTFERSKVPFSLVF